MKKIIFLFVMMCSALVNAKSKNIWRDCGIGAIIFPKTGWAAATSNLTWDLGVTGSLTTTTSPDQCAGKSASIARFIYQNYALIELDIVNGGGDYLSSILDIAKCNEKMRAGFIYKTRKDYSNVLGRDIQFSNDRNKLYKSKRLYNDFIEKINSQYKKSCGLT